MTEQVKFSGMDVEAEPIVYLGPLEEPDVIGVFNLNVVSRGNEYSEVKYLRADTATPNGQLYEMMLECAEMGVNQDDKPTRIVDEVLSRYAASDSD